MWSADGKTLFYMSDRSGAQNIWTHAARRRGAAGHALHRRPRAVADDLLRRPDDRFRARLRDLEARHIGAGRRARCRSRSAACRRRPATEHVTLNNQFQDLSLSPDGRKVVFVARGEIWAASARDGGDAVRVTRSYARESQIEWAPDSRRIVYVSERDAAPHLFLYDFTTQKRNAADERRDRRRGAARLAGRQVGRVRARRQGAARARPGGEAPSGRWRRAFLSRSDRAVAWSPDSRWVAYLGLSAKSFRNVYAVPAAGGETPRGQRAAQWQRQQHLLEPGRHLHHLQHEPAHGGGPGRPRRSDPAHAALPRGSLPRSLQGYRAAACADEERGGGGPRARRRTGARSVEAGGDRLRRHPAASEPAAGRRRRHRADHQPRRTDCCC